MAAPENDFRGQIKVFLPCWKNLSNLAFYICNDVEFQSWSQCGTLSLGRQGILQSASSEAWFNMIFFHSPANDVAHVCGPMMTRRFHKHMFIIIFASYCILAKVLRIRTNFWHVFRLFVLKLTCSPLKIAGWEVIFLLGAGLFSCFFFSVGCCGKIGSGHPCISPGLGDACIVLKQICHRWNVGRHGLETSLAFWKMQNLESRLKFLRTSLQPIVFSKGSSRIFKWPGCVVCIQVW